MKEQKGRDGAAGRTPRPLAMLVVLPVILIVLGLTYYLFVYLPSREQYFTDRAFRQLALVSEQLESVIGGLDSAIGNAAATDDPWQTIQLVRGMEARDCHSECASEHGRICVGWDPPVLAEASSARLSDESTLRQNPTLRRSARLYFAFTKPGALSTPAAPATPIPTGPTPAAAKQATLPYCATVSIEDLLMPLLGGAAFDDYDVFLASADGEILFERGRLGLRLASLPKGQPPKSGSQQDGHGKDAKGDAKDPLDGLPPIDALQQESALTEVHIGQTTYALFTQPVRLVVPDEPSLLNDQSESGSASRRANRTWVLGALIDHRSFANQSRAVSFAVMGWVPLLVLLTVFMAPAFKVWAMGRRDRLRVRDVYFLAIGTAATISLLVVVLLVTYADRQLSAHEDERLEAFAQKLCSNFQDDVAEAYVALQKFTAAVAKPHAICLAALQKESGNDVELEDLQNATGDDLLQTSLLNGGNELWLGDYPNLGAPLTEAYPFFRQLSWADRKDQKQQEKWTAGEFATNLIPVKGLSSFEDPMKDRLWSFTGNPHPNPRRRTTPRELVVHLQVSPNTGEALPTLSIPIREDSVAASYVSPCGRMQREVWSPYPQEESAPPGRIAGVATMIPAEGALLTPLIPPGYGFAVVQSDGKVVFHSDVNRNLRENLFDECEPNGPLRAAVFARRADFFTVDYVGRSQRLYLHPMENTPWTLVVFRDKELLRTVILEAAAPCVVLLLLYVALYILAATLVRFLWANERGRWMWPTPKRARAYRECAGLFTLTIVFCAWVIYACCPPAAVVVCGAIPFAAVTFAFLKLSEGSRAPTVLRSLGYGTLIAVGVGVFIVACSSDHPLIFSVLWAGLASLTTLSLMHDAATGEARVSSSGKLTGDYVGANLSLLVIVAVLPAVALFHDAYRQATETFVRLGQLQHAEARAERAAQLKEKYEGYLTPEIFERWVARSTDDAVGDLKEKEPPNRPSDDRPLSCLCRALPRGVTGLLMEWFPVYSRESRQLRELIHDRASDERWRWQVNDARTHATLWFRDERFKIRGASKSLNGEYVVEQELQRLSLPSGPIACLLFASLLIVAYAAHRGARATAETIFGSNVDGDIPVDDRTVLLTGCLLLQPPRPEVERLKQSASEIFDFQRDSLLRLKERLQSLPADARACVVVDHLEYRLSDRDYSRAKLELLEDLVLNRGRMISISGWSQQDTSFVAAEECRQGLGVIVVSEKDPLPYFAGHLRSADEASTDTGFMTAEEFDRWVRVLTPLGKVLSEPLHSGGTAATLDQLIEECRWTEPLRGIEMAIRFDQPWQRRSQSGLIKYIRDCADAHYRALWAGCSVEERLVLIHLAAEGFVSPRNWDIVRRLMSRHLIRRDPTFRVMNDSFEQFVQAAESWEPVSEWEKAGAASVWTRWRTGILVLLVVGGVFLFTTQPDQFNVWLGFAGALAGGLGTLMQLLRVFQPGKETSPH